MRALATLAIAAALSAAVALGAPLTSLPGLTSPLPSKMYSGYITVDETTGREIFYIFVESYNSPSTDPVSLWLTGGPGCSGLMAAFQEAGPFTMNFTANGAGVELNPYTWSNAMSMIYIESPVGVGFSNVPGQSSYTTGDAQTANDTYAFMQGFYKQYPQFKPNDFWVTGESYGGHYVPEIVNRILDGNIAANTTGDFTIPIKGWMVGNPWTDPETEAWGVVQNWWDRAIIGREDWDAIQATCDYKSITFWIINNASAGAMRTPQQQAAWWTAHYAEAKEKGLFLPGSNPEACFKALYEASDVEFKNVDILGVYRDVCVPGVQQYPDQINPCASTQLTEYLNRADVRTALHASLTVPQVWAGCSSPPTLTYSTYDTQQSVLYIYERAWRETDLKILVYSGDNDAIVPYTGTRMWIQKAGRPTVKKNHQWFADTNGMQVAGWATQYDKFTFATVRGAGHLVPYMKPHRALALIQGFLANHTL